MHVLVTECEGMQAVTVDDAGDLTYACQLSLG